MGQHGRQKASTYFLGVATGIWLIPLVVNFCWVLATGELRSEFESLSLSLSKLEVAVVFILTLGSFPLVMISYLILDRRQFVLKPGLRFEFDFKGISRFLLVLLVINILFYLTTGVGRAGQQATSSFGFIVYFFNLDLLFYIYYVTFRDKAKRQFWVIVLAYILFQIIRGWSGFFFTFLVIELFIRVNKHSFRFFMALLPAIYFLGAFLYQWIYPLKNMIRFGGYESIEYSEAVIKLFERLSYFSHSLVAFQNHDSLMTLYRNTNNSLVEVYGFLRPVLPSFLFQDKDFRSVNNLLMQTVYPSLSATTSSNMGFVPYLYTLAGVGAIDLTLYLILLLLLTLAYKVVLDIVEAPIGMKSYSSALLFIYCLNVVSIGSLENLSYGWLSILWTFFFLRFFGILRRARL